MGVEEIFGLMQKYEIIFVGQSHSRVNLLNICPQLITCSAQRSSLGIGGKATGVEDSAYVV